MLPDLPKLKKDLFNFQKNFIQESMEKCIGPFEGCKKIPMHEGHKHGIKRPSGDEETHNFTPIEGIISFKPHEDTLEITFEKLFDLGQQMANEFQKKAFQQLDTTLTEKGQYVDAKGISTVEAIFAMFEKIEFPLGSEGKLDMSGFKFVSSPEAYKSTLKAWKEIESDDIKSKKLEELFRRKEGRARAKEANRKLVG